MRPGMPTGRPWGIDSPQPAADAAALPLPAFDNLHHCDWLQVPMWVFGVERMRVCRANTAGLGFWRADQLATRAARDFSDASPATLLRLRTSLQLPADGRRLRESWPLYPMGQPLTASRVSPGIRRADSRQASCSAPNRWPRPTWLKRPTVPRSAFWPIGMSQDELKVIFEPFIQAAASLTRRHGGTGLGLSIARRLVPLMGGQIDVQSSPGPGSCFRFFVPVNLPDALPAPDPG